MDRRRFFSTSSKIALLFYISNSCKVQSSNIANLSKIDTNVIDSKKILNLLRRSTIGFSIEDFKLYSNKTIQEVIDLLIASPPKKVNYPINFEFPDDRLVPIGQTWIEAPNRLDVFYEQYRKKSLRAWCVSELNRNSCSLRMQMTLFFINYYSISDVIEHKYEFIHFDYLYKNSFGNLRKITEGITIDPAMLRFLSGFENTKSSPNENYARELLELFTLGKDPNKSIGEEFGNYTEEDVREVSKILTGWYDNGYFTQDPNEKVSVSFNDGNHNTDTKKLSQHFKNQKIKNKGDLEYKELIEVIFKKKEVAYHFVKRLYRWFCSDEINTDVEKEFISPLAEIFYENDFEIQPLLQAMFSSEYFYSLAENTTRIKNPLQYSFELIHSIPLEFSENNVENYNIWSELFNRLTNMGMEIFKPPSVGGWKSYYQAPKYSQLWINSSTLKHRKLLVDLLFSSEVIKIADISIKINWPDYIRQFNCVNSNNLLSDINQIYFFDRLNDATIKEAKNVLFKGIANTSDEKIIQQLLKGEKLAIVNLTKMLKYLFNNPVFNIQ